MKELKEAKVALSVMRNLGIQIDYRRRTAHEPNLTILRELLEKSTKKVAPEIATEAD